MDPKDKKISEIDFDTPINSKNIPELKNIENKAQTKNQRDILI